MNLDRHADLNDLPEIKKSDRMWTIKRGGITFIARQRLFIDFAFDLARGLAVDIPYKAIIMVGVHRGILPQKGEAPLIGIQTEHCLDANGKEMFAALSDRSKRTLVNHFDHFLDLSFANTPAYEFMRPSRKGKIIFGPHIFPTQPVPRAGGGKGLAFLGGVSPYRAQVLGQLGDQVSHLPLRTWGLNTQRLLSEACAILNIHQIDSIVTEAPRLLKAYLAGKPVVSEQLAAPIEMGRHVARIGEHADPAHLDAVYDAFDHEIARRYRFVDFLERVLT